MNLPVGDYPCPKEIYDDPRAKWIHEDGLINQRINWPLTWCLLAIYEVARIAYPFLRNGQHI